MPRLLIPTYPESPIQVQFVTPNHPTVVSKLWRAGGRRPHRPRPCRIQPPVEVLPGCPRGFETVVHNPVVRHAFRFGLYTGVRLTEAVALLGPLVEMIAMTVRIDDTKRPWTPGYPPARRLR